LGYGKQRQKKSRSQKTKAEETHCQRQSAATPRRGAAASAGCERTRRLIAFRNIEGAGNSGKS
jgi:hypothetical protein